MTVIELINKDKDKRHFSFEVLPPLKGTGTDKLFATIDKLKEFDPLFINITTHHSEFVYHEMDNGLLQRQWHSCSATRHLQWRDSRGH